MGKTSTTKQKTKKLLTQLPSYSDAGAVAARQNSGKFFVYSVTEAGRRAGKLMKISSLIEAIKNGKNEQDRIIDLDVTNYVAIRRSVKREWNECTEDDHEYMPPEDMLKFLESSEISKSDMFSPVINYVVNKPELCAKIRSILTKGKRQVNIPHALEKVLSLAPLTALILGFDDIPEGCSPKISLKPLDKETRYPKKSVRGFSLNKLQVVNDGDKSITVGDYLSAYIENVEKKKDREARSQVMKSMLNNITAGITGYFNQDDAEVKNLDVLDETYQQELTKKTIRTIRSMILQTRIAAKPPGKSETEKSTESIKNVFRRLLFSFGLKRVKS